MTRRAPSVLAAAVAFGIRAAPSLSAVAHAEVSVVILPYVDETGAVTEAAQQLTLLLQQQLLLQIAPYGNVGTVRFARVPQKCDLREVRRILPEGYNGQDLVCVSGRFFRADDEIRVQSFVVIERQGGLPSVTLEVAEKTLGAETPSSNIALMPRTMSKADLDNMSASLRNRTRVYAQRRKDSSHRQLVGALGKNTQYSVKSSVEGWIEVADLAGVGWLKAASPDDSQGFADRLPEISFLEAVVGGLRSLPWTADPAQPTRSSRAANAAARFSLLAGAEDEQAAAWVYVIRALMALSSPEARDALVDARSYLDGASKLMAEDSKIRIMRATVLLRLVQEGISPVEAWRQAKKDLLVVTAHGEAPGNSRDYFDLLSTLRPALGWPISDEKVIGAEQQELQLSGLGSEGPTSPGTVQARRSVASRAHEHCSSRSEESGVELFKKLFAATGDANYVYEQGLCYEENGHPQAAIGRFQEYLTKARDISAEQKADVDRRVAECQGLQADAMAVGRSLPARGPERSSGSKLQSWAVAVGAVGVVAVGAGGAFGLLTRSRQREVESDVRSGFYDPGPYASGRRYEWMQWVGYGVGAVAIVTGSIMWKIGHHVGDLTLELVPAVGLGQGVLLVQGGL